MVVVDGAAGNIKAGIRQLVRISVIRVGQCTRHRPQAANGDSGATQCGFVACNPAAGDIHSRTDRIAVAVTDNRDSAANTIGSNTSICGNLIIFNFSAGHLKIRAIVNKDACACTIIKENIVDFCWMRIALL